MKILFLFLLNSVFVNFSFSAEVGLGLNQVAPQVLTKDIDGKEFDLYKSLEQKPVVLIFYRGGWCPFCNIQLRKIQKKLVPAIAGKATLVAISVDQVSEGLKTKAAEKLSMTLISDPMAKILKKYRLQYKLPSDLVKTYKEKYKINIEGASGQKHHIISVPAVYVVGKDKKIKFAFANTDYKVRAENKAVVKVVNSL